MMRDQASGQGRAFDAQDGPAGALIRMGRGTWRLVGACIWFCFVFGTGCRDSEGSGQPWRRSDVRASDGRVAQVVRARP